MKKHLYMTGSDYIFSEHGYSDLAGHQLLKEGFEIVEGDPPKGAEPYKELTAAETLDVLYNQQTTLKRAQYAPLKAAVNLLLEQKDYEATQALIQGASVAPEDESIKQALLELLK
jgi:hypothetical protein